MDAVRFGLSTALPSHHHLVHGFVCCVIAGHFTCPKRKFVKAIARQAMKIFFNMKFFIVLPVPPQAG